MANAGKDAFVTEANIAIDGASNAMSLISLGSVNSSNYKKGTDAAGNTTYCFTLDNLKNISLWDKDDTNYAGKVVVTVPKAGGYSYTYTVTCEDFPTGRVVNKFAFGADGIAIQFFIDGSLVPGRTYVFNITVANGDTVLASGQIAVVA
jgi:hypothetical protein